MKKSIILLSLCFVFSLCHAQQVVLPKVTKYIIFEDTLRVWPVGQERRFSVYTKKVAVYDRVIVPENSRVVYPAPLLPPPGEFKPGIKPFGRGLQDPVDFPYDDTKTYIDPDFTKVTDSGTQVVSLFYSPAGGASGTDKLNTIRFKPNDGKEIQRGTMCFYFEHEGRSIIVAAHYTQEPLPPLQTANISTYVRVEGSNSTATIELLRPFACGDYDITPVWEYRTDGTWKPVSRASQTESRVSVALPAGDRCQIRGKLQFGQVCVYSNICTVLRPETVENENYIRKYSFNGQQIVDDITYYDGLGYPRMTVNVGASPSGRSIVTPVWYDAVRRDDARTYLPYVAAHGGAEIAGDPFAEQEAFYKSLYGSDEGYFYAEKRYEASALDRPVAEFKPGSIFHSKDKKIDYDYRFNAADEVRKLVYDFDTGNVVCEGAYPANSLQCYETTSEDGMRIATFYDLQQRKVLERTYPDDNRTADTYSVYDDWGKLCWVIPPEGSDKLFGSAVLPEEGTMEISPENEWAIRYCFLYRYDGRGRLIERRQPGREAEYLVYDRSDRPVMTQDGNQRAAGRWVQDKLDEFGRLSCRRSVMCALTRSDLQHIYDDDPEELALSILRVDTLLVNEYDVSKDYEFVKPEGLEMSGGSQTVGPTVKPGGGIIMRPTLYAFKAVDGVVSDFDRDRRVKGLLTRSRFAVHAPNEIAGAPDYLVQRYYYDYKGRLIQQAGNNQLGGLSRISYRYDAAGNLLARHESHQQGPDGPTDVLLVEYTYDSRGRQLTETASLNGSTIKGRVENTYDELGRIEGRRYDAQTPIEERYTYNLQGWQTGRSNPYFSMRLNYYEQMVIGATPSYSGNISKWSWTHMEEGMLDDNHAYAFDYDRMQRLRDGRHWVGKVPDGRYGERDIAYDLNGNIVRMYRTGSDTVRHITLNAYDGNRLKSPFADDSRRYEYDANGNCTRDPGNNLQIGYNSLNLMQRVADLAGTVHASYAYCIDGSKLTVRNPEGFGYEYLGSLIYQRDASGLHLESAGFGGGRLIRRKEIVDGGTGFDLIFYTHKPDYYLTDHLGSVRVVVNYENKVLARNDYYPFGGRWNASGAAASNRWQFNGKESQQDFGLKLLDYGARMYDSGKGRWLTQDPLAEKYYSISPYAYCANNPILFVDTDGKDYGIVVNNRNKTITVQQTFYVRSIDYSSAKKAANFWNNQNGHTYTDKSGGTYNIKFSLAVRTNNDPSITASSDAIGNSYKIKNIDQTNEEGFINGITDGNKYISIDPSRANTDTGAHEIGHTLNMDHSDQGIMTSYSNDPNRDESVSQENIDQMIERAKVRTEINTLFDEIKRFLGL